MTHVKYFLNVRYFFEIEDFTFKKERREDLA